MRRVLALAACGLGLARPAHAQQSNCADVTIAPEVLALVPNLRNVCQVIVGSASDDAKFVVVDAEVSRSFAGNGVEIRFRLPNGTLTPPRTFAIAPETEVRVGGARVPARELSTGQHIAMFIDVAQPEIAIESPTPSEPLVFGPLEAAIAPPAYSRRAPSGFIWIGGLALLLGAGVAILRIRRESD